MTELGDFLRSRRSRLDPADLSLPSHGTRRVPGLRREELALAAGVSPAYYTRLEQGHSANASPGVLDALARALRLDPDERTHLHDLARPRTPVTAPLRPDLAALVDATAHPVLALNRRTDVVAWNPSAHALYAPHLPFDSTPNLLRLLFLDPRVRALHQEWPTEARRAVASLRMVAGRWPDTPDLAHLIGDLVIHSPEFADLWSDRPVHQCTHGVKLLRHPVGDLTLTFSILETSDDTGHRLMFLTPDKASEAAVRALTPTT
ncbi:helix-turn-helix domain-containing protein [Actinokineospora bangkokensis]|uniref:HTH cro/C1-type domain-containing protein n=1 Tax=Actinokineospora bangkokensis TaxID=1193682 RepID=A0A1Q9LLB2_9PSEU|nr:helix-turn-helix transcriptional regulator [Actinokineospora bangkokensis]OLR92793.1 hypothetical protein BJP25_19380 [Actinokineospora bangkokensis]